MKKIYYITCLIFLFTSCEKELLVEQVCCDWDASNFDPNYNGHNVNQLYFTGSSLCNDDLCVYENSNPLIRVLNNTHNNLFN